MRSLLAALFVLVTTTGSAAAQGNPQTREGFWISFGIGYGSLACDDCEEEDESLSGGSVLLRMGGTMSQRLLIGGEVNGWGKEEGGVSFTVANLTPILVFYPSAEGGFFLKGGLGLATAEVEWRSVSIEETGLGITLGVGYDARVGRNFALTPYLDLARSNFDGISFNRVSFGLGFTWP